MKAEGSGGRGPVTWKQAGQLVLLGVVTTVAAVSILATIAVPEFTIAAPSWHQLYTALLP
jgi:hypothetical protein